MSESPRRVARESLLSTRQFTVVQSTFETSDHKRYERAIVEHPGAVVILPLTAKGTIFFVRQYRAPIDQMLFELPAGTLEKGEEPSVCASRELEEEIGFKPGKLQPLITLYPAPGFCSEKQHCFIATELSPSRKPGDEDEHIEVVEVSLLELKRMIQEGKVEDAKTLAVLFLASARSYILL